MSGTAKRTRLTVFAVKGTAPSVVPSSGLDDISNTVRVPFHPMALSRSAMSALLDGADRANEQPLVRESDAVEIG